MEKTIEKKKCKLNLVLWEHEYEGITTQGMPSLDSFKWYKVNEIDLNVSETDKLDIKKIDKKVLASLIKAWRYDSSEFRANNDPDKDLRTDYKSQSSVIKYAKSLGINLTRRTLDRLECGETRINSENAKKIKSLLNLPVYFDLTDDRSIKRITDKYLLQQGNMVESLPDYFIDVLALFNEFNDIFMASLGLIYKYNRVSTSETDPASMKNEIQKVRDRFNGAKIASELMINLLYQTVLKYIWCYNGSRIYKNNIRKNEEGDDEVFYKESMRQLEWESNDLFVSTELEFTHSSLGNISYEILINLIKHKEYSTCNESMTLYCLNLLNLVQYMIAIFEGKNNKNSKSKYIINNLKLHGNESSLKETIDWGEVTTALKIGIGMLDLNFAQVAVLHKIKFIEKYLSIPDQLFVHMSETAKKMGLPACKSQLNGNSDRLIYSPERHGELNIDQEYLHQNLMGRAALLTFLGRLQSQGLVKVTLSKSNNVTFIELNYSLSDYIVADGNNIYFPEELAPILDFEYDLFALYDDVFALSSGSIYSNIKGGFFIMMACSPEIVKRLRSADTIKIGKYLKDGSRKLMQYDDQNIYFKGLQYIEKTEYCAGENLSVLSGNELKSIADSNLHLDCSVNEQHNQKSKKTGDVIMYWSTPEEMMEYCALEAALLSVSFDDAAYSVSSRFASDNTKPNLFNS